MILGFFLVETLLLCGKSQAQKAIREDTARMYPKVFFVIWSIIGYLAEKHTIQGLQSFGDIYLFTHHGHGFMHTLKLSYNQLDEKLKLCVSCYSLFSKELVFDQDNDLSLDDFVIYWSTIQKLKLRRCREKIYL